MDYKLIATDMDGTLLNDNKEVSVRTMNAIEAAKAQGVLFTICTGRNISGIKNYMEILKPTGPVICNNGALIMSADGADILYKKLMEREDAIAVYKTGCELGVTMVIWCDNVFYTNEINDRSRDYKRFSNLDPVLMDNFEILLEKGITKILFSAPPERISEIKEILKNNRFCSFNQNTTICQSLPFFLEFFNSGVSKGKALEFISEYCGIEKKSIIAFGDGMNDMPMIEAAGFGVAMENAFEEIKQAADYVTVDNNHDGVAVVLEEKVLRKVVL